MNGLERINSHLLLMSFFIVMTVLIGLLYDPEISDPPQDTIDDHPCNVEMSVC